MNTASSKLQFIAIGEHGMWMMTEIYTMNWTLCEQHEEDRQTAELAGDVIMVSPGRA